ncbi:Holliday junction resolvase RuvX [Mammaliicoccus stepanovicii]|uniref:Putative pre-16S rRNA nuclease n=1 Tax=Mammaliicoccus stepanovicii TaxID=643214 RepID=A0A239Z541_9STAP|nr:Holliday junction resolvase RuvX [Mammaliicoccus stepanovicii]PNZ72413.1 Holliday junction resolvase RuvX [Mammaliicoccus stepanovicii]GGI40169.1 putative pre-16S rRNA nuclease [Mammaliicoccus stepanovicii]SNV65654.1 Holliday junction resolvase [Mammaliicoccus stepanovicii]
MLTNRIIGLDVGSKTIGVAVSDAMGWTAQGIDTLRINEEQEEFGLEALIKIIDEYNVDTVIIGLPKNMNNSIGPRGDASIHFKDVLAHERPDLKLIMWDERLSTVGAERSLLEADVSRKKRKKVIDKMAAVFILQGYLDSIKQ